MKYTVMYERTVRVREYETLKIGFWREFDDDITSYEGAYNFCKRYVDHKIKTALKDLREKDA